MLNYKTLLSLILWVVALCNPEYLFAQLKLPNQQVIKDSSILQISVTKHTLPDQALVSSHQPKTTIEQEPYLWATYWFNKKGMPDSMYNYMDGIKYRSESYTYDNKGELVAMAVVNHKGETTVQKRVTKLSKGNKLYATYNRSGLKEATFCNKRGYIYLSKKYVNPMIFGYDSVVFTQKNAPFYSSETYFANGVISHKLSKSWVGSGPDSFYQSFYQSNAESGRMPSYQVGFEVTDSGQLVVPNDFPFPKMFESVSYENRFSMCTPISEKIDQLLTEKALNKQSETFELQTPTAILRHYYTFDYAFH